MRHPWCGGWPLRYLLLVQSQQCCNTVLRVVGSWWLQWCLPAMVQPSGTG